MGIKSGSLPDPRTEPIYCESPPFPRDMTLDLSAACNHACIFCPNRKQNDTAVRMPLSLARDILRQAYDLGTRSVGLYGLGESLLVKNFEEYVRAAKEIGYEYIYDTTNGSLLTPARLERMLDAGLNSVKFSINAYGRDQYKLIHGRDQFDKVMTNLEAAIAVRKRRKFSLLISCAETRLSAGAGKALRERFGHEVDSIAQYECSSFNGMALENHGVLTDKPAEFPIPCPWLFNRVSVTPWGYLSGCCGDYQHYIAVADLRETPLREAWTGETFRRFRRMHLDKNVAGTLCECCVFNATAEPHPLVERFGKTMAGSFFDPPALQREIRKRSGKEASGHHETP